MSGEQELNVVLNLRISPNDDERIRAYGAVPRSRVARRAMRLGLKMIEQDPALLLTEDDPEPPKDQAKKA